MFERDFRCFWGVPILLDLPVYCISAHRLRWPGPAGLFSFIVTEHLLRIFSPLFAPPCVTTMLTSISSCCFFFSPLSEGPRHLWLQGAGVLDRLRRRRRRQHLHGVHVHPDRDLTQHHRRTAKHICHAQEYSISNLSTNGAATACKSTIAIRWYFLALFRGSVCIAQQTNTCTYTDSMVLSISRHIATYSNASTKKV